MAKVAQGVIASSVNRVVIGLGVTGLSCARYFYSRGMPFSLVDTRADAPGLEALRAEMPDISVYAGEYPADLIISASELVVSPGVPLEDPLVQQAMGAGVAVIGDVDIFVREAAAPVVGITGSNAKSTVTELVGQMARDAGKDVGVGGNLGPAALDLLAPERELYVLELSSFQLERAGELNLAVAAVLNITPDHLDRHGSMPRYHHAKHRIFRGAQTAVVNHDDPLTIPLVAPDVEIVSWRMGKPELGGFGLMDVDGEEFLCHGFEPVLPSSELGLAGRHNVANALAALGLGHAAGLAHATMATTLRQFRGLPHRCQRVAEIDGVSYINDSKGTNIGATVAALNGIGTGSNIVLIAGGQGKGADFSQMRSVVAKQCRAVILIGEDAPALEQALAGAAPLLMSNTLEQAVELAAAQAYTGDSVLLSPACASFDMFSGYIQRGEAFCLAVEQLKAARS